MGAATIVTAIGPADEARKLALPAKDAETLLAPAFWLTPAIAQAAVPFAPVTPLQVCAVPPLPSVNKIDTPTTGVPPVVCVRTAERFAALPFVNVVGPV